MFTFGVFRVSLGTSIFEKSSSVASNKRSRLLSRLFFSVSYDLVKSKGQSKDTSKSLLDVTTLIMQTSYCMKRNGL